MMHARVGYGLALPLLALALLEPGSARADHDPSRDDDLRIEVRGGWLDTRTPTRDRDYWPDGYTLRLLIPAPELRNGHSDLSIGDATQVGLTLGFESFSFEHKHYEADHPGLRDWRMTDDWLWILDAGAFARQWLWIASAGLPLRFGLEGRAGLALSSSAEVHYRPPPSDEEVLGMVDGADYERRWGIGPAGGATALVAISWIVLGAGIRIVVADGTASTALVFTVGVIKLDDVNGPTIPARKTLADCEADIHKCRRGLAAEKAKRPTPAQKATAPSEQPAHSTPHAH